MGYALFAQKKLVLDTQLNSLQLQQTQRSDTQYQLATDSLGLQQQLTSMQAAQSAQLKPLYDQLASAADSTQMAQINAQIQSMQSQFDQQTDAINREIYLVGVKENAIEMEVKHLDTQVTAVQKQLDAVQEAEGQAIDRATPKFKGLG